MLTTALPASNVYVLARSTEPISLSPSTRSRTLPRYLTPLAVAVAVRETIEAVTAPPKSSRSSASACAVAVPSLEDVVAL